MQNYLVTGANKGIGLAVVRRILLDIPNSRVFLGSRNVENGEEAAKGLVVEDASFGERVNVVKIDVGIDESVAAAKEEVEQLLDGEKLVGLVNNAGVKGHKDFTPTFEINVRGIIRVTDTFAPLIHDNGRVVNMTSGSAPNFVQSCNETYQNFFKNRDIEWSDLDGLMNAIGADRKKLLELGVPEDKLNDSYTAYGLSKAIANSLTIVQAREHPTWIVNACTPGFVMTDMTVPAFAADEEKAKKMGMLTPDQGTKSTMHLLTSNSLKGRGHYYGSDAKRSPMHVYRAPGSPEYEEE